MSILKRLYLAIYRWVPILLKYFSGYISVHLFHKNLFNNDIWLITEKPGEARDNGYHLFKYIRTTHPEINAHFVITSDSSDRDKIVNFGNIIEYNSKEHMLYYLAAKYSISSQSCGAYPYEMIPEIFKITKIFRRKDQKCVFLQHGIIQNFIPDKKMFYSQKIHDLFVTSATPERKFIIEKYGYPASVVQKLGLCRFDSLNNTDCLKDRIILLMPTWRSWLKNSLLNTTDAKKIFLESEYFATYKSLLMNEYLLQVLEKNSYKIVFYPHFALQKYIDNFDKIQNKSVIIANKDDYDVQDLLIRSSVLVTDYSSVYFDFAYMGKPVIYYQFDEEQFRKKHYQEGYFSYREHGFGKVLKHENEVIDEIEYMLNHNCIMDSLYKMRRDNFFDLIDNENCKRNFEAITKL